MFPNFNNLKYGQICFISFLKRFEDFRIGQVRLILLKLLFCYYTIIVFCIEIDSSKISTYQSLNILTSKHFGFILACPKLGLFYKQITFLLTKFDTASICMSYEDLISSVQCVFMLLPINLQIGRLDIVVFLLGGPCGWPPLDKRMHLKPCPYFACCKSYSIILPLKASLVLVSVKVKK